MILSSPTRSTAARDVSNDLSNDLSNDDVPRSIARTLDLLEVVLAKQSCNLTTAALASEVTPTTALRYLRALEVRGYIDRDGSGDFSAGPTLLRIAASLRAGSVLDRLATVAQPHLDGLAQLTGESTYLAVGDGTTGTYIATAESPRAIRHVGWIGQNIVLDGTALGAALASPGTSAVRTGAVEPDITALSRALPANGKIGIAVSIIGPEYRFTTEQIEHHDEALGTVVDALDHELQINGEDFSS